MRVSGKHLRQRRRRIGLGGLAVALAAVGALVASGVLAVSPRASATVVNGSETFAIANPFPVAIGNYQSATYPDAPPAPTSFGGTTGFGPVPDEGVITATGVTPGTLWEAEVCNGIPITTQGWVPTANCVGANAQTVATAAGTLSIDTSNPSFQFDIWHGEDPLDSYFNCLAPTDDPNGTETVVGDQPIDPSNPSWGASVVGASGGGTAPCQLILSDNTSAYSAADIAVPLTGLDGVAAQAPGQPAAPTAVAGAAGSGSAVVSFAAASTGGTPTSFSVVATDTTTNKTTTSNPDPTTSPFTFNNLTLGDSYTFSVTAIDASGNSAPSPQSAPVLIPDGTAPGAPGTPTATAGSAGSGTATITYTAPTTGGAPTKYVGTATDTSNPGTVTAQSSGPALTMTFTGLTVGDSYTFTVTGSNAAGPGTASAASAPLTIPAVVAPGTPAAPTVTAGPDGSGTATVDFSPPTTGPTPTSYTVTATDVVTTSTVTASGASSPISVSGLTTGDTYTFTVTAVVGSGDCAATPPTAQCATSPASADVVIPAVAQPAAPDEPTINTVVPGAAGSGTATVSFAAAPTGTAATSFTVTALDQLAPSDTVAETVTSSPAVVTGLTPGQTYTFSLVANNAVGSSSTAFWAPPVTPQVVDGPELPTITGSPVRATAGHRYAYQIVLGGMPAPDAYVGGTLPTGLHMTLKGLLEGTPTKAGLFSFTVTATSTAGSASRTVTLRVEPGPFHELRLVGFSHLQALRSGYAVGLRLALADRYGNTVSLRRTLTLRIAVGPADFAGGLRTVTVRTGRGGTATTPRLFVTGRSNVDIDVSVPGLRPEVIVLRVIR